MANAVKFTGRGTVIIRALPEQVDGDALVVPLWVEDTGIGIAPEVAGRLFSAFEQADNSTTRRYGGTGLGLAITRKLAQLMGGDAGVTQRPRRRQHLLVPRPARPARRKRRELASRSPLR